MKKLTQYILLSVLSLAVSGGLFAQHIDEGGEKNKRDNDKAKVVFTGKITDAKTGEALSGASVYIADLKTGAITNKDGLFTISNIAAGRH